MFLICIKVQPRCTARFFPQGVPSPPTSPGGSHTGDREHGTAQRPESASSPRRPSLNGACAAAVSRPRADPSEANGRRRLLQKNRTAEGASLSSTTSATIEGGLTKTHIQDRETP